MPEQGEFRWKLTADDSEYQQATGRVQKAQERLVKSTARLAGVNSDAFGPKQQRQIDDLNRKLAKQSEAARKAARDVEDIRRQYEVLSSAEATPTSLKRLEVELSKAQREIQKTEKVYQDLESRLMDAQDKYNTYFEFSGVKDQGWENEINALIKQLDSAGLKLGELDDRAEKLQSSIERIKLDPESSIEAQKLADKLQYAEEKAQRLANEADNTAHQISGIASESEGVGAAVAASAHPALAVINAILMSLEKTWSILQKIGNTASRTFKEVADSVKKVTLGIFGADKGANGFLDTIDKLRKRILSLATAALVFNVIRRAFTSLKNYLWDVIKTNDEFISSLASIKGNLLTAFQPIYEAVLPALNALLSVIAKVTAYLAALINLLFGKSINASQGAAKSLYDQAKALGAVGSAADKAAGKLAAFDEINVLTQDNSSGGGSGGADITPDFDYDFSWFDKYQGKLDEFLDVFRKAWDNVGDYVLGGWEHALTNIIDLAKKIGDTFLEVWTDGRGQALLEAWLHLLGTILYIAGDIAKAFSEAWDFAGYDVIASVFEALTDIALLLDSIAIAFRDAWNDRTGVSIALNLYQIFSNIMYSISQIAQRLREAWEANGNGVAIWNEILGVIDDILSAINQMASATLDWAHNLNLEPAVSSFKALMEALRPFVNIVITDLAWAYTNVLLPFGKWLAEIFVPKSLDLLATLFKTLTATIESLSPAAERFWENFLKPFGEWSGDIIIQAFEWLMEKLNQFSDWVKENPEKLEEIITILGSMAAAAVVVTTAIAGLVAIAAALVAGLALLINPITQIIFLIGDLTSKALKLAGNFDNLKSIATGAWTGIKDTWSEAGGWFESDVIEPITEKFSMLWENATEWAKNAWETIQSSWEGAPGWFDGSIVTPITEGFKDFINNILGFFESMGNGIIGIFESAINYIIDALNSLSLDIPDWVPKVGGKSFGVNIPKISLGSVSAPKLATGAVIPPNREFAAILGDQKSGTNIEAPLDTIVEAMEMALSNTDFSGGEVNVNINFSGDLAGLARVLNPVIETEKRRAGVNLIAGGAY